MLRNKEIFRFAVWFFLIALGSVIAGYFISIEAVFLVIVSSAAFAVLFFIFTKKRYQSIAKISEQIDLVLHNDDHLFINDSEEGELSILQNEITKMTLRIREQNESLKREKEHLADSLADIAHQLRTPLTSANLILSLLEKNPPESEQKMLLHEMEQLFAQMEWLIESLLKLSRLDAGIVVFQNKTILVEDFVHALVQPFLISMELHNITLHQTVPHGMAIMGDVSWLTEALQNILKNCIQSVGDNGCIEIICQDTLLYSEIVIQDNGDGFEKEDIWHLFERFYRGKKESTLGYGIGLALCKTIITRHGGTITAQNRSEGGAVFCIRFSK